MYRCAFRNFCDCFVQNFIEENKTCGYFISVDHKRIQKASGSHLYYLTGQQGQNKELSKMSGSTSQASIVY